MSVRLTTTPIQDGFHMPGEFEAHAGCWMLWPYRPDVWRAQAGPAQRAWAAVAAAIAAFEPLTIGVAAEPPPAARQLLPSSVQLVPLPSDDAWMRDIGPTFVVNDSGAVRGVVWQFNAWGGAGYAHWEQDAQVARRVMERLDLDYYLAPFVMEGGAIHVDGQGTLLAIEECLLSPQRNPHLSRAEVEAGLRAYLGVETIIWLPRGLVEDETGGHIDNLCCFARPGEVILHWTDDPADPDYEVCQAACAALRQAVDARGRRLHIHTLLQPGSLLRTAQEAEGVQVSAESRPRPAGQRLTASYINHYLANGAVIVPTFDVPQRDQAACRALQDIYPERRVVGVPSREIVLGGGNIHCITQQQPLGRVPHLSAHRAMDIA